MRELERNRSIDADPKRLAIVGHGRLGSAFAAAAQRAGIEVTLTGRDGAIDAARGAEALLLAVPDASIAEAAAVLASADPPPRFAGHTSGATALAELAPFAARGAECFSLHPLQTIPGPEAELSGAPCAIAGETPAAERLARRLGERLGMRPFAVPEDRRAVYHAAASIASNFLVALEESAAEALAEAGVGPGRETLAPLVLRTAANWVERGPAALTGPIARGDEATVERHLAALRETVPDLVPLYEALAARTRAIAERPVVAAGRGEPGP